HTGPATIAHGDYWLNNVMYREEPPRGQVLQCRRGTSATAARREVRASPSPPCSVGEPAMTNADPGPFGALLLRLRAAAGLPQEQLAARAGLSPKAIAALERGKRRSPRAVTVELLANALGLDADTHAQLVAVARAAGATRDLPRHPWRPAAEPTPL